MESYSNHLSLKNEPRNGGGRERLRREPLIATPGKRGFVWMRVLLWSAQAFDDNRRGASAAVANAGAPESRVVLLEHVVQGADDANA